MPLYIQIYLSKIKVRGILPKIMLISNIYKRIINNPVEYTFIKKPKKKRPRYKRASKCINRLDLIEEYNKNA